METHHPIDTDTQSDSSRLSRLGRRLPDPIYLVFLMVLAVPGYLVDSLAFTRLFLLFGFAGFWPLLAMGVAVLRDGDDGDERKPTDWIDMGDRGTNTRAIVAMLALQFQPVLLVTGLCQIAGHVPILARHRGRLPAPTPGPTTASDESDDRDRESASDAGPAYRLPFEGTWTVVNGSTDREYSHSWGILTQRYAYDFVITDEEGKAHEGERGAPEAYYCFGEPILAPADGTVVATRTDYRDYHRTDGWLDPLQRDIRGNYVTIDHGGEYSVLAHLERGSVTVEVGDRVERGQQIARCGNSGNTTEPHLHFHVQDHPNFFLGAGLPVRFASVRTDHPRAASETHDSTFVHAGQRVTHVGD